MWGMALRASPLVFMESRELVAIRITYKLKVYVIWNLKKTLRVKGENKNKLKAYRNITCPHKLYDLLVTRAAVSRTSKSAQSEGRAVGVTSQALR